MENPPPSISEPEPKKLKMSSSTTTSGDDNDTTATTAEEERKIRYKRRKVAIFFAYCGVGYQGMQKNPGAKTIEGELEEALFLAGAVPEADRGCPKRFDWARSARTDKGVSAVGQVVSGRFYVDPPGLIDRLNSILPPQIRIFGYNRVTASFNAKKFCDRRRYVYLMPVFALDPSSHPDRESVLASLGSGNELVRCSECSERGRKVEGIMGKRCFEQRLENSDTTSNDILENVEIREVGAKVVTSNNGTVLPQTVEEETRVTVEKSNSGNLNFDSQKENGDVVDSNSLENVGAETGKEMSDFSKNGTEQSCSGVKETTRSAKMVVEEEIRVTLERINCGNLNSDSQKENGDAKETSMEITDVTQELVVEEHINETFEPSGFSYGAEEKERFNRILKHYEGTHNFHNFTTRIKAEDPSATRYIISFEANTVVNVEGIDFVKCEVVGQSFMLHQIRKMVGVAVAIMRNCADESLIGTAFQKGLNITVPTAPEVGLYLDECFFSSYNQKWKDTHEEISMKAYADEAEEFKMKHIYSHIASTEHKEGAVALWLHSLNHRNYPDLRTCSNGEASQEKIDEPKGMN